MIARFMFFYKPGVTASVRGWLGTAACERLESQLGAPSAACACARGRTGWPGGVRGGGPGRARRAAWPERGPRMACPGGGRGRVSRGQKGPGQARGREERKEREGEGRRGKRKREKEKKWKKEREKKEKGGERNKERKREGGRARRR